MPMKNEARDWSCIGIAAVNKRQQTENSETDFRGRCRNRVIVLAMISSELPDKECRAEGFSVPHSHSRHDQGEGDQEALHSGVAA